MKSDIVAAVVQAGAVETRYVRAGWGRPVVLLLRSAASLEALAEDAVFNSLSRDLRVVAPAVPSDGDLTAWVRDLLDGLGLDRPAVVADAAVAGATMPILLEDRCSGVVVLHASAPSFAATSEKRVLELQLTDAGDLGGADLDTLLNFVRHGVGAV